MHLLSTNVRQSIIATLPAQISIGPQKARDDNSLHVMRISFLQQPKDTNLNCRRFAVLWDSADDFDRDSFVGGGLYGFNDLAKGSLAEELDESICA